MARTAIRHAIYSAAAAQSRFPVSPHPQEPMSAATAEAERQSGRASWPKAARASMPAGPQAKALAGVSATRRLSRGHGSSTAMLSSGPHVSAGQEARGEEQPTANGGNARATSNEQSTTYCVVCSSV
eukprot:scaffold15716_cov119-Isochrysis_galbana.AAC.1